MLPVFATSLETSSTVSAPYSASSDYYLGIGACDNISDRQDKKVCLEEVRDSLKEDFNTCSEQFQARQEVCRELGKGPYDPNLDQNNFVNSEGELTGNLYFPLTSGKKYTYQSIINGGVQQTIEVTVGGTTTIDNILCRIVTDKVYEGKNTDPSIGKLLEDTIDWFAQDVYGNVWYFGETTIAYTYDEYGNPTASTEGSWMAGVDEAKPGIIMYNDPDKQKGSLYRQEFALGTAEDLGEVVETGVPASGAIYANCVHTQDSSALEPGVVEDKYYASGVGLVLTIDPDGTREELIPSTP